MIKPDCKTIVTSILLLFSSALLQAQDIQTDRPDQTETPFLVPKGYFQVETGFFFERANTSELHELLPTTLLKYGVNEFFELRLIPELYSEKANERQVTGLKPLTTGMKFRMLRQKHALPSISLIGHLTLPFAASKPLKAHFYAPSFRFLFQHTLSEKLLIGYNLGAEWDGETPDPTFIYTLTAQYTFTKKTRGFIELYGFAPQQENADHRLDGGVTYLLTKNAQFDISAGAGLTDNAPDYFISCGFSFRVKTS